MIEAFRLRKVFPDGTVALDGIDLQVSPGEFIAIVGRSGAGKTTLLRSIDGTLKPTAGSLNVLGVDVASAQGETLRALRSQIGFIFQQFNLLRRLSVFQNVLLGKLGAHSDLRGALGAFSEDDKNRVRNLLREVGLEDRLSTRVDQLSGGQQQRVAIARALAQEPKIILADEPMASLDPRLSEVVLELLKNFNQKKNITVVTNIHVLDLAKKYAKRIIGVRNGKLVFDGTPEKLSASVAQEIYQ